MGRAIWCRLMGSAVLLLCLATDASAQYFGRNKVQYDADRVLVLATDHFDIYYSQEDAAAAALAARMAERWHARLTVALQHTLRGRQPIVLYGSHRRFEQTNVHSGLIDESTGGFTDSRKRRIVLPFAASLADTDHVLGHEIVHAFQFDIADQHRSPLGVPLWFVEGMAEYLTLGAGDPQTAHLDEGRGPGGEAAVDQGAVEPALLSLPLGSGAVGITSSIASAPTCRPARCARGATSSAGCSKSPANRSRRCRPAGTKRCATSTRRRPRRRRRR